MNREIVRMNLTGLEPELRQRVKDLADRMIRTFNGAPENVAGFNDAREIWSLIEEIEAG